MDLIKFVPEQLLILVAALYVVGVFFKNTSKVADWVIPWVLLIVGILGALVIEGFTGLAIIEGVICAGVAVLTNQLIKQSTTKRE